ncbi:helix-turn-helix transcriptional regulator [Paraburkholderia acidiphila]|uniref:HTH domain-containing protein n=1 Tax=Paraburkholderia acidiphila TaxID=2571747 RepID=A0A7Z2GC20_9BURK|nr:YafY family protein [Paraburkholderia acidiphila]QGZ58765.1 HTH domain-containing protein [Paraburkholderia acidiphila]
MRRADRLFQIIQILRRAKRPVTARVLSEELEVSMRTVYRDIADLMGQRVPVSGEAGIGYVLDRDYDMPPLMLTPDELEAAVLGAQWVAQRSDPALARAARDLIAKIAAALPDPLRLFIAEPTVSTPPPQSLCVDTLSIAQVREWIRAGRKLRIRYRDELGRVSERTIWPLLIGYADAVRLLAAWCELRQAFRHFRTDRIVEAAFLEEEHEGRRSVLMARWKAHMKESRGVDLSE